MLSPVFFSFLVSQSLTRKYAFVKWYKKSICKTSIEYSISKSKLSQISKCFYSPQRWPLTSLTPFPFKPPPPNICPFNFTPTSTPTKQN